MRSTSVEGALDVEWKEVRHVGTRDAGAFAGARSRGICIHWSVKDEAARGQSGRERSWPQGALSLVLGDPVSSEVPARNSVQTLGSRRLCLTVTRSWKMLTSLVAMMAK